MSTAADVVPAEGPWTLTPRDPAWPEGWRRMDDPPRRIRGTGRVTALAAPCLAVVGTRRPTHRGLAVARRLAADLAAAGWTIVSGLALGIDAAAHAGALDAGGVTVAVMGTGIARTYPARHRGLRRRIEANGCVVTEAADDDPPRRFVFPRRNRLIAALAAGVLVVEAPRRSGALLTAYQALDANRDVFAVPGPVDCPQARGCHHLLREGAHLVESAANVHAVLPPPLAAPREWSGAAPPRAGTPARWLWDRLDLTGLRLSELRCRWPGSEQVWQAALLELELAGLVVRLPGARLARKVWLDRHGITGAGTPDRRAGKDADPGA